MKYVMTIRIISSVSLDCLHLLTVFVVVLLTRMWTELHILCTIELQRFMLFYVGNVVRVSVI